MTTMATAATTTFTPFKTTSSDSNLSASEASPTASSVQQQSQQQQHPQQPPPPPPPPALQAQHQQQLQQGAADTFSSHHASSAASSSSSSASTSTTTTATAHTAATRSAKSTPRSSTASNRTPSSISSGSSSAAMKRNESAMSGSTSAKEERRRKDAIDKVLQRAEIARITRHFKTRLALAAFKAQRGWQDATLDQIEPHLEQEAQRHKQQQQMQQQQLQQQQQQAQQQAQQQQQQQQQQHMMAQQQFLAQQEAAAAQQQLQYHRSQPPQGGAAFQAQKSPAHYANGNGMEYAQPYQQHLSMQQPPQQAWGRPGPFDNAGMGPPSFAGHKRARSINVYDQPQQSIAYPANLGAYGSPQPMASTLALQPPVQIGANGGPAMFGDANRPTKRRVLGQEHGGGRPSLHHSSSSSSLAGSTTALGAITELRSPRSRHSATRSSLSRGNGSVSKGGRPVSSSDPNFSTFVDAASVLTGLSKGPSDQSDNSDEGMQGGAGAGPSSQSNPFGSSIPRPRTPPSANDKGKGVAIHHMSGANGAAPPTTGGESSAEGAAELMLYLAQSPSPVQSRSSHVVNNIGGEGMMKGRRLFSGSGEDHSASSATFGNGVGMNGVGGGPNGTGRSGLGSYDEALHPAKASHVVSAPQPGSPPSSMLGPGAFGGAIPSTPGRERQISSSWDAYINVSPSPQRASVARSSEHSYASNGPPPTFLLPNGTPPGSNAPTSTASTTAGGGAVGAAAGW